MRRITFLAAAVFVMCLPALADEVPKAIGKWHLVYTLKVPGAPYRYTKCGLHTDDRKGDDPKDYPITCKIPDDGGDSPIVDHVESGRIDCVADVAASNGCSFTYILQVEKINDHQVNAAVRNNGGRASISFRVFVSDLQAKAIEEPEQAWITGKRFIVRVPKNAITPAIIGSFNGDPVLFSPADPLSDDDKKRFELLDKKDLATETIFLFRVKG